MPVINPWPGDEDLAGTGTSAMVRVVFVLHLHVLFLLGCAQPGLNPDADLVGDPLLAALPRDAALVVRVHLDRDGLAPWQDAGLVDLAAIPLTGLPDQGAAARGATGCVVLLEGEVEPLAPPTRGAHRWVIDVGGTPLLWRRLAADKAVAGEVAAVHELSADRADGASGLDRAELQGAVPDGDVWVVARDPDRLVELATARGFVVPTLPAGVDLVESIALSARHDGDRVALTARAVLVDRGTARALARAAGRVRLDGWRGVLADRASVVQVDNIVEVQGLWLEPDELSWLLTEVAP